AESQAQMKKLDSRIWYTSAVALGDSFRMSIVRTILRGMAFVTGQSSRMGVSGSVGEGIDRLLEHAAAGCPSRAELVSAVDAGVRELGVAERGGARATGS